MSKLNQLVVLRNVVLDNWSDDGKFFMGKILTIIDACIQDSEQRKGIKDLIKNTYYGSNYRNEIVKQALLDFAKVHCPHLVERDDFEDSFMGRVCQGESNQPDQPETLFKKE